MRRPPRYTLEDILDEFRKAPIPILTRRLLAFAASEYGPEKANDLVVRAIREAIHGDHTPLFAGNLYEFLSRVIERIA